MLKRIYVTFVHFIAVILPLCAPTIWWYNVADASLSAGAMVLLCIWGVVSAYAGLVIFMEGLDYFRWKKLN